MISSAARKGSATILKKIRSGRVGFRDQKPFSKGSVSAARSGLAQHMKAGRNALRNAGTGRKARNNLLRQAAKTGGNRHFNRMANL